MTTVKCPARTENVAGILAAAQQDLEFHSRLAVARHHLENLLAGLSAAVAAGDSKGLVVLLRGALFVAEEHDGASRLMSPDEIITRLGGCHVILTTSNLSLTYNAADIEYAGTYQCWAPGRSPRCVGLGTFRGRLVTGPQVWKWSEHVVHFPFQDHVLRELLGSRPTFEEEAHPSFARIEKQLRR